MVSIFGGRCARDNCTQTPSFNVAGMKTEMFRMQHAEDGMVNVFRWVDCSHRDCVRPSTFGVEGRKKSTMCEQHAIVYTVW